MTLEEEFYDNFCSTYIKTNQKFISDCLVDAPDEIIEWIETKIDEACKKQREICAEAYFKGTRKKHTYEDDMNTIRNAPSPEIK